MKPTASFIMNSFLKSDKKHILITGKRNCGKSTLINEIASGISDEKLPGITTKAVPAECVVMKDNISLEEAVVGRYCADLGESNAMVCAEDGFSVFGVSVIEKAIKAKEKWIMIDEIGYLESEEAEYKNKVIEAFDKKQVLAVVRKQDTEFINSIKEREDVFVVDMDELRPKVGCVIMASGESRRFGSNKLLAEFEGKTFIQKIIDTTKDIFDRRVVVTRSEEAEKICRNNNCDVIIHKLPDRNDTTRLGTEYLDDMDAIVFCPCDQPMLDKESIIKIVNAFCLEGKEIVRLSFGEKAGAPVLFSKKYFEELKNLPSKCGGGFLAKKYPENVSFVLAENEAELFDVDTRDDLIYIENINKCGKM